MEHWISGFFVCMLKVGLRRTIRVEMIRIDIDAGIYKYSRDMQEKKKKKFM